MFEAIATGLVVGSVVGGLAAFVGWLVARRADRLPVQDDEDRAFDAMVAAQLREWEATASDIEAATALAQTAGMGIGGVVNALLQAKPSRLNISERTPHRVPLGLSIFDTPEQKRVAKVVRRHDPSAEAGVEV